MVMGVIVISSRDETVQCVIMTIEGIVVFDARYDPFRGTIISTRIFQGTIKPGDIIRFMSNDAIHKVEEVGLFQACFKHRLVLA